MKKLQKNLLVVCACLITSIASANVIYVDQSASGPGDGLTWGTAFTNVQAGINLAVAGDEVWVAKGVYKERITTKSGVALYGGFSGTEASLAERNWQTNASILDGNQAGTAVAIPNGSSNTTRVDGFTIQNGFSANNGGGVYCGSGATAIIANNKIVQNATWNGIPGGGIDCNGSPQITNNIILGNQAWNAGGGIYVRSSASPSIRNNRIIGNYCVSQQATGGGIMISQSATPQIVNNFIAGNCVVSTNGYQGIANGGGIYCNSSSSLTIVNNTLIGNGALQGGGIYVQQGAPMIGNNIIAYNSSGLVYAISAGSANVRNNCLFGNDTTNVAGIPNPIGSNGNISVDPMLTGTNTLLDVHLQVGSPCIDAGNNSLVQAGWADIDGASRSNGAAADIGADEWDGTTYPVSPKIVRVSPTGNDMNDGSTWLLAKQTIRGALAEAVQGVEVWAQAGVYNETNILPIFSYLYGGFNGTETNLYQRNWKTNATVLDGGAKASVLLIGYAGKGGCLDGVTIRNGKAPFGGGINCAYSSLLIANNTMSGNVATYSSATITLGGGAASFLSSGAALSNNVISGNAAVVGGGIHCSGILAPTIENNLIRSNSANNLIVFQSYVPMGGGIYSVGCSPNIINNVVSGNVCTNKINLPVVGGGIYCSGGAPLIANNTIMRNSISLLSSQPEVGGAIFCDSTLAKVINNIVAFNSSGMYLTNGITVRNNCTGENRLYNYAHIADPTGLDGNISVDPGLGAFNSVHLLSDSPCRDAGDNSVVQDGWADFDGNPRVVGGTVDIGADELDGTTYPSTGSIIRVSTSGNDTNDGASWNTAKRTVQGAINAASAADGAEIWVQGGTYKEKLDVPTFVYLFGGFNGTETNRDQRNWATNLTVLDPNRAGAVVLYGLGTHCALSGFTVQNAVGSNWSGAVSVPGPCKGFVMDNRIINNLGSNIFAAAGCGIYAGGRATIINNVIAYNRNLRTLPNLLAGGIFCDAGSAPLIANNTIVNNSINGASGVGYGIGGIFSSNASPVIVNNIVAFNQGGIAVTGGAPVLRNNCVFGNGTSNYVGVVAGPGDITVDPQLGDLSMNFALLAGSPCIDAGDGSVVESDWMDVYARSRVAGGTVDIGAYESSTVAEWLPWMHIPNISIFTVGGISYLQYSTVLTNDGFRAVYNGPVVRNGTNFSQDFRYEWFTGATTPASNVVSGTLVLGALAPGYYSLTTSAWGVPIFVDPVRISSTSQTLTGVSANGAGFQMNVAGIAEVDYIVQASTNLTDWISVQTNHGGPFVFTDAEATNGAVRFYRVQVGE